MGSSQPPTRDTVPLSKINNKIHRKKRTKEMFAVSALLITRSQKYIQLHSHGIQYNETRQHDRLNNNIFKPDQTTIYNLINPITFS
jgi:hypothetical protein